MLRIFILLIGSFLLQTSPLKASPSPASPQPDSITVYLFLHDACIICQNYSLTINELHEEFAGTHLEFIGLFPNFASKPEAIAAYKKKYHIPFALKTDYFRTMTQKLGATITPEVFVYNQTREKILYRGRIDNTYVALGRKRHSASTSELRDALQAIRSGQQVAVSQTKAVGCLINANDRLGQQ
ncbi:MAG: hypothetical protein AAGG75_24955 [Bacteroidota bacterium]